MSNNLAKCSCNHCDGHLEFDTAYAGARVACPHCGMETLLFSPVTDIAPPTPSPAPAPIEPAVQSGYRLADSTGPRTPAPRPTAAPPRNTPPPNTNPFARQAARASWISFVFAMVLGKLLRSSAGAPANPVWLLTVAFFVLIGFAFAVIALFGIRKHGTKGILMPGVIGLILNGLFVGVMLVAFVTGLSKRHELQQRKRQVAASLNQYVQQRKSGATVKRMPSTGDANIDASFQIIVDLGNEVDAVVERMHAELAQLEERGVCLVLTNKAAIKSEVGKRSAGQAIIQTYEREAAALVESARQRCLTSRTPQDIKQSVLRQLDKGGQFQCRLDESFSVSVRLRKAEFDLLQFVYLEFGRYKLVDEEVRFATSPKQEEYNRLSQRLGDVSEEAEAFNRRQSETLEALPDRIKEITK